MKRSNYYFINLFFLLQSIVTFAQKESKPLNLLDKKLSHWYKWIGSPHKSVKDLPKGTPTGDGFSGIPMGYNDSKGVFKSEMLDGERVLHVSGEIYGGLTTKLEYENYHLQLKYKWGTKKWAPRLKLPKDCGIMYHLTGPNEDAVFGAFMMGLECQICEKSSGELFLVMNKDLSLRPVADVRIGDKNKFDVNAPMKQIGGYVKMGSVLPSDNFESDASQWTTMDLYTIGNSAIYMVNGHVVNALSNAGIQLADKSIRPLTKGKIQFQSEGAEVYYKDVTIQSITDFPADVKKAAGLTVEQNWKLGVALYSFHNFSFPDELAKADSAGLKYVEGFTFGKAGEELKDSIIMNLSPSGIEKLNFLIKKRGLTMESIYVIGGNTLDKWKKEFNLAKQLNLKYITAEPPIKMLGVIDSLAGVFGIKVAIHNHWKGMSAYWHPDSLAAVLKNRPNLGACPDLGHSPKSGINPVEALKKLEGRIIGIHLKDISAYNDPQLKDVPLGTGIINFQEVFKELKRQNFKGNIMIERDAEDKPSNLQSVIQTVKYYNEILDLVPHKSK